MRLTFQLGTTQQTFNLNWPVQFRKMRMMKAYINSNGMNHTNSLLLFKVNNYCQNYVYDADGTRHDYTFSVICPVNNLLAYDRLINDFDYDTLSFDENTRSITITIFNNDVNLTMGGSSIVSLELEFI